MRFSKVNNIVGWIVGILSITVYVMTMEATGSFWDCGEFISSCFKLEVPHPPGAPLFAMMGRFFIILFGDDPHTAAHAVNFMSALGSGISILFLFWIITHFARRVVMRANPTAEPDQLQTFLIMTAGVIGAGAGVFTDSYWYSAVEGEVYATSAFFTALVFWSILKWEKRADQPGADRWIIFIFYMMGLSIGVHLLNLLTIPAIVMVYYFKRFRPTVWGTILAFIVGCAVTGFVQLVVIQYTIKGAGNFDVFFVNSLNMPFFIGFGLYFLLMAALLAWGLLFKRDTMTSMKYRIWLMLFVLIIVLPILFNTGGTLGGGFFKLLIALAIAWVAGYFIKTKSLPNFKMALWCFAFMLLGYSTYFTTMIRSNADVPVDMYNVDNPVSLVGYLSRDQYGDWPIIYGPDFTDQAPYDPAGDLYVKGDKKYEVAGQKYVQQWGNTPSSHVFPRMWDPTNDRHEIDAYRLYSDMGPDDNPTMADNIKYFIRYQTGWMYLRYFMWNFSGKQNDLEGFGNPRDGNAITGIPFIDNFFLGDQSKLPDTVHTLNKSYNRMYMLPLILGLIGLVFHFLRDRKGWIINGLLFFFTGEAIVIYLNQAGYQPRERDYAFAGSTWSYCIWIGLGAIAVYELFRRYSPKINPRVAAYTAATICFLAVPLLMGTQEWNDHDRHEKTLPRDLAKDYLESCPPDAMLFSFGDNDTYPLWYAQEVEGIRPDVRVIVNTLLGTDWYMNSLRYKVNQNDRWDVIFTPDQIMGDRRNVVYFTDKIPGFDPNKYYDCYSILKNVVASDDARYTTPADNGSVVNLIPTRKLSLPVDSAAAAATMAIHPGDSILHELHLDIPSNRNYLMKNDLAMLAVISGSKWKRPICFTSPQDLSSLGLDKYVRMRGMVYQLDPVEGGAADNDASYKIIMNQFAYGNAGTPGVYYDEENRRHLNSIKFTHAQIAMSLAAVGKKDSARNVLEHYDHNVLQSNMPYGMTSNQGNIHDYFSFDFLQACYMADDSTLARKVSTSLKKDLEQQMRYYRSLGDESMSDETLAVNASMVVQNKGGNLSDLQAKYFAQDILSTYRMLMQLNEWEKQTQAKGTKP